MRTVGGVNEIEGVELGVRSDGAGEGWESGVEEVVKKLGCGRGSGGMEGGRSHWK